MTEIEVSECTMKELREDLSTSVCPHSTKPEINEMEKEKWKLLYDPTEHSISSTEETG